MNNLESQEERKERHCMHLQVSLNFQVEGVRISYREEE